MFWLLAQNTGKCVMRDGFENMGELLSSCNELVIVSRNCYGGFSACIKNVIDRSISISLPFFTKRNGEMHHIARYKNQIVISVYFYYSDDITEEEKNVARKIVKAMKVNFNARKANTLFANNISELREALE
jgi:multimeric flavodoxin WrbA